MGDFNPSSPTVRGAETRVKRHRTVRLDSSLLAFAQRIRPGAVTISHDHCYLSAVEGNPGLAVEYVSSLNPTMTTVDNYPGTDTGQVTTGWTNSSGTAEFSLVDDKYDTSDYMSNTNALSAAGRLDLQMRGALTALVGMRISKIVVKASVKLTTSTTNSPNVKMKALLNIGSTTYPGPVVTVPRNGRFNIYELATFEADPSTDVPWTLAAANAFCSGGTNEFGLRVAGKLAAGGFLVSGMWLEITYCTENRLGYYYSPSPPRSGWAKLTLSGTSACSANTWYYRVVSALKGTAQNYAELPILTATVAKATTASQSTGEHRQAYRCNLPVAGAPASSVTTLPGDLIPHLADVSGTINSQSQPFVAATPTMFHADADTDYGDDRGQEITTAAATAYAAVQLSVGWQDPQRRPNRSLTINVRASGTTDDDTGTPLATAVIHPRDLATGAIQDVLAKFDVAWTNTLNTKYNVFVRSEATAGRGWVVPLIDTRSDNILTGASTTTTEVEGASVNGQTDSYRTASGALDRFDLPLALVAPPTAPTVTATPVAGVAGLAAPYVQVAWSASSLTTAFGGYRVYRRPTRGVAESWVMVADITVPTGYTATTVEANHLAWRDFSAGWSVTGGQWADGWDYAVTTRSTITGLESVVGESTDTANTVSVLGDAWMVCNTAPYLNAPLANARPVTSEAAPNQTTYAPAGRDFVVVRTRAELPARMWDVEWAPLHGTGEDVARYAKAAAASGRQVSLMLQTGDVIHGSLSSPVIQQTPGGPVVEVSATLTETGRSPDRADINLPAAIKTNGSTSYAYAPYTAALNPTTSPCTLIYCGSLATSGGIVGGINGTGTRYLAFSGTSVNSVVLSGAGATTSFVTAFTGATTDGTRQALAATHSGTAQVLYVNGVAVNTSAVTTGSIDLSVTSTNGWAMGGAGSLSFAAVTGQAFAYYTRVLTAAEVKAASYFLLGIPGYRMPYGAVFVFNLADARCWNGHATTLTDLTGNRTVATLVGTPGAVGIPFDLADVERF